MFSGFFLKSFKRKGAFINKEHVGIWDNIINFSQIKKYFQSIFCGPPRSSEIPRDPSKKFQEPGNSRASTRLVESNSPRTSKTFQGNPRESKKLPGFPKQSQKYPVRTQGDPGGTDPCGTHVEKGFNLVHFVVFSTGFHKAPLLHTFNH